MSEGCINHRNGIRLDGYYQVALPIPHGVFWRKKKRAPVPNAKAGFILVGIEWQQKRGARVR